MSKYADRVVGTTIGTGTGTLTLTTNAVLGYRTFAASVAAATAADLTDGGAVGICIVAVDNTGIPSGAWEVCESIYAVATNTVTRGTLLASSTGSRIDFTGGTKQVMVVAPASIVEAIQPPYTEFIDVTGLTGGAATITLTAEQNKATAFEVVGTLSDDIVIITADNMGVFAAENLATGAYAVMFKTAAGTGMVVPADTILAAFADGTDVDPLTGGAAGAGNVVGPASATNNAFVLYDGTTGKFIKNSAYTSASFEFAAMKDASGGYAGLTGFAVDMYNTAGTFLSNLYNTATAARTWLLPDKSGTIALLDDIPTLGISTFMLQNAASSIGGAYWNMPALTAFTAGALGTITTAGVGTGGNVIGIFATPSGVPALTSIPAGLLYVHFETQKVSGSNNYYCYVEVYKRVLAGTETLLLTSDNTTQSASNTVLQNTVTFVNSAAITLLATDRLVIRIYGKTLSSTCSIDLTFDATTNSRFELPTVTNAGNIMFKDSADTVTGVKTFSDGSVKLAGATSGASTLKAPAIASNYVHTLPAATGTFALTSDLADSQTYNYVDNGGMAIARRPSTAYGVVNTPVYGMVDRWLVGSNGATTHTAGTIDQAGGVTWSPSTFTLKATTWTLTGAGSTVVFKHRIVPEQCTQLNSKNIIVQALVAQDTGGSINYTISVNKANSSGDFSAVTNIGTSGNLAVASSSVGSQISYTCALGSTDANYGLEIVITAICGAVTSKNFQLTSVGLYEASTVQTFALKDIRTEQTACEFFLPIYGEGANTSSHKIMGFVATTTNTKFPIPFRTKTWKAPSSIAYSNLSHFTVANPWTGAGTPTAIAGAAAYYSKTDASLSITTTAGSPTLTANTSNAELETVNTLARIYFLGAEP